MFFNWTIGGERPATTATALVLDGAYDSRLSPVNWDSRVSIRGNVLSLIDGDFHFWLPIISEVVLFDLISGKVREEVDAYR